MKFAFFRPGNLLFLVLLLFTLVACRQESGEIDDATAPPTPTTAVTPLIDTPTPFTTGRDPNFIVVATDAPNPPYEDIDPFGNIIGFDADVMAGIAAAADLTYEFVVTPHDRVLQTVAERKDFDAVMSALVIPADPVPGIVYTDPYLEVGQVLVVRANERAIQSYRHIQPGTPIGVQRNSSGELAAQEVGDLDVEQLLFFDTVPQTLQALIDGVVEGGIIDSTAANHFTATYPQQLKIAGGSGRSSWMTAKSYGIAVAADNEALLERLNQAVAQLHSTGAIERLVRTWLVPRETIAAGESLIGTPPNELVIGVAAQLTDMDPAARDPDLLSWEVKMNTMSGLLMVDADNNLIPLLAADYPLISEDKLEYTFTLRPGLTFPSGVALTADDVKWSIDRAAGQGSWLVNGVLKKNERSAVADADAVQVIDPLTVKFVLQEPAAYFVHMLATPPFFIISRECYTLHFDPGSVCGGIGPYNIFQWEANEYMRLKANPQWPGPAPTFESIQLRFYDDPARMRRSLENGAIDIAWSGLPVSDIKELQNAGGFIYAEGPAIFKSYLVFEQSEPPWDDIRIRQAAAYAVDREALAGDIFQNIRRPLYSPVPDSVPGHVNSEPLRDLGQSRALLAAAGYTADNPLPIIIWYLNDGRYTPLEAAYAQAIKEQLEETEVFQVTLQSAPWDTFRPQSATCNYPAFLLGWPPTGWPPNYLDAMSWLSYFVTSTETICSNYESEAMEALLTAALAEVDEVSRQERYAEIQELWAVEFPTLNLTQELRVIFALPEVANLDRAIDALGLLHYSILSKSPGGE